MSMAGGYIIRPYENAGWNFAEASGRLKGWVAGGNGWIQYLAYGYYG